MTREEVLKVAKPILFNVDMVRAIQNGTKTVTRRVIKFDPNLPITQDKCGIWYYCDMDGNPLLPEEIPADKPPYQVGDILYVRETWARVKVIRTNDKAIPSDFKRIVYYYRADGEIANSDGSKFKWKPSIHMPKEAARIFLRVTSIRVERLQDITEEQAIKEGVFLDTCFLPTYHCGRLKNGTPSGQGCKTARECFGSELWNSTVKESDLTYYGWKSNPRVRVIEFERVEVT